MDSLKKISNILPYDGIAEYYGQLIPNADADEYYQALLNKIAWENDRAVIFGKTIITKRKVAWYADEAFSYTYSKVTKTALLWTKVLQKLKAICEEKTGQTYNSCLLNLYHNGTEGMAWHNDAEKDLKKDGSIASLSFGAVRKFSFKHKNTKETISLMLDHGSLLEMRGTTQTHWLHKLPPMKSVLSPRINLTFRMIDIKKPTHFHE